MKNAYIKDPQTNVVINNDKVEYESFLKERKKQKEMDNLKQMIAILETRLSRLENMTGSNK